MNNSLFEIEKVAGIDDKRVAYADGGLVFLKGDVGDCAYVVVSGSVEIREGGRVLERMESGELFGEMALIDSEPRTASAVAVGPTELLFVDHAAFDRLVQEEPGFAMKVMRLMSRRLRATLAAHRAAAVEEFPMGVSPRKQA